MRNAARVVCNRANVDHHPIAPEEGMEFLVQNGCRAARDVTRIVKPSGNPEGSTDCAQIFELPPIPEKRMSGFISLEIGKASNLATVINGSHTGTGAAQRAKIEYLAVLPDKGMSSQPQVRNTVNAWIGIDVGNSRYLPVLVDTRRRGVRATQGTQVPHRPFSQTKPRVSVAQPNMEFGSGVLFAATPITCPRSFIAPARL